MTSAVATGGWCEWRRCSTRLRQKTEWKEGGDTRRRRTAWKSRPASSPGNSGGWSKCRASGSTLRNQRGRSGDARRGVDRGLLLRDHLERGHVDLEAGKGRARGYVGSDGPSRGWTSLMGLSRRGIRELLAPSRRPIPPLRCKRESKFTNKRSVLVLLSLLSFLIVGSKHNFQCRRRLIILLTPACTKPTYLGRVHL